MKKLKKWFSNLPLVKKLDALLIRIKVNKAYNIDLKTVLGIFFKEIKDNSIDSEANAVAFNFTLAVFPSIIFLFTLIPYFPVDNLQQELFNFIDNSMPHGLNHALKTVIIDITEKRRGGLLTFGFLFAAYLSTNGMIGLIDSFNKCYRTREKRSFLKKRLVATMLTLTLVFVLLAAIAIIIVGNILVHIMIERGLLHVGFKSFLIHFLQYSSFIFLFLIAISTIFYFAPAVVKRWKFFSVGSVAATILAVTASTLFSLYLANFATYNEVYGSIGTLIAFMLWMKVMSAVLLIGFELNASIDTIKRAIDSGHHVGHIKK